MSVTLETNARALVLSCITFSDRQSPFMIVHCYDVTRSRNLTENRSLTSKCSLLVIAWKQGRRFNLCSRDNAKEHKYLTKLALTHHSKARRAGSSTLRHHGSANIIDLPQALPQARGLGFVRYAFRICEAMPKRASRRQERYFHMS